jgi:hypothetical protein
VPRSAKRVLAHSVRVAAILAAILLLPATSASAASKVREVCVARVTLYDTPHGFIVGRLTAGRHVRVLAFNRDARWARVRAMRDLLGWLHASALC